MGILTTGRATNRELQIAEAVLSRSRICIEYARGQAMFLEVPEHLWDEKIPEIALLHAKHLLKPPKRRRMPSENKEAQPRSVKTPPSNGTKTKGKTKQTVPWSWRFRF